EERDVERIREHVAGIPVARHARHLRGDPVPEAVAKSRITRHALVELAPRELARHAESRDPGQVLRAAAPAALLRPTAQERWQRDPAAHDQASDALRPAELVRR